MQDRAHNDNNRIKLFIKYVSFSKSVHSKLWKLAYSTLLKSSFDIHTFCKPTAPSTNIR